MGKNVIYYPNEWQYVKEKLDQLTGANNYGLGGAKTSLLVLDQTVADIASKIEDLDSDKSIAFFHFSKEETINQLFDDYQTLANFCLKAGDLVADNIDTPFYTELDAFVEKLEGLSLHNYKTENRIGVTQKTTIGYGMQSDTIETEKEEINVNDIFTHSKAFDAVLSEEYKQYKQQNPDAELSQSDFSKAIVSSRGFEYQSISDKQKAKEVWRDILISGGIIVLSCFCPPAGFYISIAYGGLTASNAVRGKDWLTNRVLSTQERIECGVFAVIDMIPLLRLAKGIKLLGNAGKIGGKSTKVGNVVESIKDNSELAKYNLKLKRWEAIDKINDIKYGVEKRVGKSLDNVMQQAEVQADGTVIGKGTNFSNKFEEAYKTSKAKIGESLQQAQNDLAAAKTGAGAGAAAGAGKRGPAIGSKGSAIDDAKGINKASKAETPESVQKVDQGSDAAKNAGKVNETQGGKSVGEGVHSGDVKDARKVEEKPHEPVEKVGEGAEGVSNPNLTEPSLSKGGELTEDEIVMLTSKETSKGHQAELDTAKLLKKEGYDIKPLKEGEGGKGNGYGLSDTSNPDYLIEGEPFDCYAPESDNPKTVINEISKKSKKQAERITLNVNNYKGDIGELKHMILRKTNGDLRRLKELLVIKDGQITRWFGRGE
ncbi:hypothetical protein HOO54_17310 [Bacillus sp. WMMC1349]|uniref:CdiA C-terminal domain-containing protein n=1 Tax=Bacillus sp. WMMC1349 TaxID=2736254 RepID=UPI001552B5F1|nr:hypothetical protein [Bacillus sp. WMMC1349]NPC93924.1 hypothetical protein [Bacillus sp. WMMC1349]